VILFVSSTKHSDAVDTPLPTTRAVEPLFFVTWALMVNFLQDVVPRLDSQIVFVLVIATSVPTATGFPKGDSNVVAPATAGIAKASSPTAIRTGSINRFNPFI
jgi:hypothetical protein